MVQTYPFGDRDNLRLDPVYDRLRREEPVTRMKFPYGGEGWLVTGYEYGKVVLADPRFSCAATTGEDVARMLAPIPTGRSLITMDPPEHTRVRQLVSKAFTVRRVEELRPHVQQITDELIDRFDNPAELVEGLAMPLPVTVICELLGVPVEDRADFRRWTAQFLTSGAYTPEESIQGRDMLLAYFGKMVAHRREHPSDDLFGALVVVSEDGDRLSEHELIALGLVLLVAGHENTANQIGNIVVTLLDHPDQLAALRADPERLPDTIEELLRFIPVVGATVPRIALEDVELGGVTVAKGDAVLVDFASCNRDEAVYDRAGQMDPHRDLSHHLAFGHGLHYCLGAQLARLELQVAIGTLLRRFPGLRLAEPVEFRTDGMARGPRRLLVTW